MEINSIIICTVDREPDYIHETITRLLFTLPEKKDIHLVVDDTTYKNHSIYKDFCKIHFNEPVRKVRMKRAKYNYIRCLELSYFLGGLNLILEDDVLLRKNWYEKVKELNPPAREDWVFSLNCIQNKISSKGYEEFHTIKNQRGQRLAWCKPFGVIYQPRVLSFVAHSLNENDWGIPHDIAIGISCYNRKVKIYECVPTLIEHIGKNSCINEGMVWKTTKDEYGRFNHECISPDRLKNGN